MIEYYKQWLEKYPFVSIEDPFDQDDWESCGKSKVRINETVSGYNF